MLSDSFTPAAVAGRTEVLTLACSRGDRAGRYPLMVLIERRGPILMALNKSQGDRHFAAMVQHWLSKVIHVTPAHASCRDELRQSGLSSFVGHAHAFVTIF